MDSLEDKVILVGVVAISTSIGWVISEFFGWLKEKNRRKFELKRDIALGLNEAKREVFAEVMGALLPLALKLGTRSLTMVRERADVVEIADILGEIHGKINKAMLYSADIRVQELLVANRKALFGLSATVLEHGLVMDKELKEREEKLEKLSAELMGAMQKELGIEAEAIAK